MGNCPERKSEKRQKLKKKTEIKIIPLLLKETSQILFSKAGSWEDCLFFTSTKALCWLVVIGVGSTPSLRIKCCSVSWRKKRRELLNITAQKRVSEELFSSIFAFQYTKRSNDSLCSSDPWDLWDFKCDGAASSMCLDEKPNLESVISIWSFARNSGGI